MPAVGGVQVFQSGGSARGQSGKLMPQLHPAAERELKSLVHCRRWCWRCYTMRTVPNEDMHIFFPGSIGKDIRCSALPQTVVLALFQRCGHHVLYRH